jgi:hypothetical protein
VRDFSRPNIFSRGIPGKFFEKSKKNQKKLKKYSIFPKKFRLNICGVKCLNTLYDEVRWGKLLILNHLRPKKGLTSRL